MSINRLNFKLYSLKNLWWTDATYRGCFGNALLEYIFSRTQTFLWSSNQSTSNFFALNVFLTNPVPTGWMGRSWNRCAKITDIEPITFYIFKKFRKSRQWFATNPQYSAQQQCLFYNCVQKMLFVTRRHRRLTTLSISIHFSYGGHWKLNNGGR